MEGGRIRKSFVPGLGTTYVYPCVFYCYLSSQVGGFKLPFVSVGAIIMVLVLVIFLQLLGVASTLGMIPAVCAIWLCED